MWVAHVFEFSKAQCLLCDGATDDILFCRRQAIGEKGDKFHCQVGCGLESLSLQSFVKKSDSCTLMLFGNLDMEGTYTLALRLCKGGGCGGSNSGEGDSLRGFIAIPDVLELESKGDRGAIWVELMHKSLQKFCEVAEVHVFM